MQDLTPLVLALLVAWLLVAAAPAAAAQAKPTAVVSLGDSAISGESARAYEPGTDTERNLCHRSRRALIQVTAIPGVATRRNLACSGAVAANLQVPGTPRFGEAPQSARLAALARTHDIRLVVVTVGANDDPRFSATAAECVARFLISAVPGCAETVGPAWAGRVAAMAPKVERALADLRGVLDAAGQGALEDRLVLTSYSSPVGTPPLRYAAPAARLAHGCPLYDGDLRWANEAAVPALNATLRGVAARAGWRFLDLSRAMTGRETCALGTTHAQEWVTGLRLGPQRIVRESFHPNARGHAQLGACVTELAAQPWREAACLRGSDGALHAVPLPA